MVLAESSVAQHCEAYYPFDDTLADMSGNGQDGLMIAAEGAPGAAQFAEGVSGRALHITGGNAMRAFANLHYDGCPQVTVTAWVRLESLETTDNQYVFSTGQGSGPGLYAQGSLVRLNGTENGLLHYEGFRDARSWFFVAGIYDYDAGRYALYWRDRVVAEGHLSDGRYEPEDSLWIGTLNDELSYTARSLYVDDLRVYGRPLSLAELQALGSGGTSLTVAAPSALAACEVQDDCAAGTYCAFDGTCHPESHLPRTQIELDVIEVTPVVVPLLETSEPENAPENAQAEGLAASRTRIGEPQLRSLEGAPAVAPAGVADLEDIIVPELRDEISCDTFVRPAPGIDSTVTLTVDANVTLPERFRNALDQVAACGYYPDVVVLNNADQWIVSAGEQIAYSPNVPDDLAQRLNEFETAYGGLDAADLTPDGRWLIAADGEVAQSGVPTQARLRATATVHRGDRIVSFALSPVRNDQWILIDDNDDIFGEAIPWQINAASSQFEISRIDPREIRFHPDGSWILLGSDGWYISDGLTDNQLRNVNLYRNRRDHIAHFLGYRTNGAFVLLSDGRVPTDTQSSRFENFLTDSDLNINARMAAHNITGAAVAVVRVNEIRFVRGYGLRDSSDPESYVLPNTAFDFASVSKAVSAVALMRLVEDGLIDLEDEGVLEDIETLIPQDELDTFRDRIRPESGNVAQVMQHCAGFCYGSSTNCDANFSGGGAHEYPVSRPSPPTADVLLGTGYADYGHRLQRGQGSVAHRYTTGNYNLIQALIDVHAGGFLAHTDQLFADLGMGASTFRSPYRDRNTPNFARGHEQGVVQPMVTYGELAGASLVSTAEDIARFVIAVNEGGGGVISGDSVDILLGRDVYPSPNVPPIARRYCAAPGDMALGINYRATDADWDDNETYWHNGDHNGYHAMVIGLPGLGAGLVVVMTSSTGDDTRFYNELKGAFEEAYGL